MLRGPAAASAERTRKSVPKSVANGHFEIGKRLDAGCFGEVYAATDTHTGREVAVKIERSPNGELQREVAIMKLLSQPCQLQGFAKLYHFGKEGRLSCIVMERLGSSLLGLSRTAGGRFTAKTAALVAEQALGCLELLHSRGIVHRDIKPENFMCGVGPRRHHLYLIDFGMAVGYHAAGQHVPFQVVSGFSGNLRYASINAHQLHRQSRRDDLEALGHLLCFLLRGSLPWSGIPAKNWEEQSRRVLQRKESTDLRELNSGHPAAFREYLSYCRSLAYSSRPDYAMLRGLFVKLKATLARQEGRAVEEHDVEWVSQSEREDSVPLQPWAPARQPDDARQPGAGAILRGLCCWGALGVAAEPDEKRLAMAAC